MERSQPGGGERRTRRRRGKGLRYLEYGMGGLLCALTVATPWMFGTTQEWSVRLMNVGCALLGLLFIAAWIMERMDGREGIETSRWSKIIGVLFFGANLLVLGFCAVAWVNYRATFSVSTRSFTYNPDYNPSLPFTYDRDLTLQTLVNLVALFVVFWVARYWLLRGETGERRRADESALDNPRLRLILWVLSLNGLALAVQGTLQRLSGSPKLLWFKESWWGTAEACFGPFSYRGNAAEFLNLLWPIAFAAWWMFFRHRVRTDSRKRGFTDGPDLLLIPAFVIMAIASVLTLSRGGAAVAAAMGAALAVLFLSQRFVTWKVRLVVLCSALVVVAGVWALAWETLSKRLSTADQTMSGRVEIYENAKAMAADYPKFGTGPGSFRSVYHLYREHTGQRWHGFLHDDWLETRATFGQVGLTLVCINLGLLLIWILAPGRPPTGFFLTGCGLISLVGALVHAKYDFPFQTYSIFFTFVVVAAILTSVSPVRSR